MVPDQSKGLLESDLYLRATAFDPENTLPATRKLNSSIIENCKADVKWWEVSNYFISYYSPCPVLISQSGDYPADVNFQCGPEEYRRRRAAGETPFPPSVKLDDTSELVVRSTRGQHDISCRVFGESAPFTPRGLLYHIHGGGFVIGSASG